MENENGKNRFFLSLGLLAILFVINLIAFLNINYMNKEIDSKVNIAHEQIDILPSNSKFQYSDEEKQIFAEIRNLISDVSGFLSKYIWAIAVGLLTSIPMLAVKKIANHFYKDCMNDKYSDWINRAIIVFFLISMIFVSYDINSGISKLNDIREISSYIEKTYGIISSIGSHWLN